MAISFTREDVNAAALRLRGNAVLGEALSWYAVVGRAGTTLDAVLNEVVRGTLTVQRLGVDASSSPGRVDEQIELLTKLREVLGAGEIDWSEVQRLARSLVMLIDPERAGLLPLPEASLLDLVGLSGNGREGRSGEEGVSGGGRGANPVPPIEIDQLSVDRSVLDLLGEETCRKHVVLPVSRTSNAVILATSGAVPPELVEMVQNRTGLVVEPAVVSRDSILNAIERLFGGG